MNINAVRGYGNIYSVRPNGVAFAGKSPKKHKVSEQKSTEILNRSEDIRETSKSHYDFISSEISTLKQNASEEYKKAIEEYNYAYEYITKNKDSEDVGIDFSEFSNGKYSGKYGSNMKAAIEIEPGYNKFDSTRRVIIYDADTSEISEIIENPFTECGRITLGNNGTHYIYENKKPVKITQGETKEGYLISDDNEYFITKEYSYDKGQIEEYREDVAHSPKFQIIGKQSEFKEGEPVKAYERKLKYITQALSVYSFGYICDFKDGKISRLNTSNVMYETGDIPSKEGNLYEYKDGKLSKYTGDYYSDKGTVVAYEILNCDGDKLKSYIKSPVTQNGERVSGTEYSFDKKNRVQAARYI